jgi:AcrR family transcriptional regulator
VSDLKRKILDASVELVAERGVRGVSFREVARRAGVSHQAPYHEFENHLGIMRAIAREGFATLADAMETGARGREPLDALIAAGVAYVRFAQSHLGHFRVMFERTLVDVHDPRDPMPEGERTYGVLVGLSQSAVEAGYGRGLGTPEVAGVCWSVVHGVATLLVEGVLVAKAHVTNVDDEFEIAAQVVKALGHLLRP